jgi:hypothetical protein
MWWVLCLHAVFTHRTVICLSPHHVENSGQSQMVSGLVPAQTIQEIASWIHVASCWSFLSRWQNLQSIVRKDQRLATWIQMANWQFPTQSTLGQDTTDHLTPCTISYAIQAGRNDSCLYKHSMQTTLVTSPIDDGDRDSHWNIRYQLHIDMGDHQRRHHCILLLWKLQINFLCGL